ncbi:calcium-dependent lipid-binding (CaLB domain) family protein [Actinidia rufa]|uniref:Calcium-dependent lipid-binding (CaLB domain) family protein n=1 Tax=Actinidia rufa TaxID=165716 RepID=A0A7J0FER1_9ERIC|nr:calcium-dependent lipid-binding (CaLB domain) family protein [Actinidia rufa]
MYDKDTFTEDDKMGDATIDMKPYIECLRMGLENLSNGLRNIEQGEVEVQIEWVDLPGRKAFRSNSGGGGGWRKWVVLSDWCKIAVVVVVVVLGNGWCWEMLVSVGSDWRWSSGG